MTQKRQSVRTGQESVWDYPRPPAVESVPERIRIVFNEVEIVSTVDGKRVLETSHPPNYYLPLEDFASGCLEPTTGRSFCEWKGDARYFDVVVGNRRAERAAWSYPHPTPGFEKIRNHVAVYAHAMDQCLVDGELARPQPGMFYGGWITDKVVGPFKGEPGTEFW